MKKGLLWRTNSIKTWLENIWIKAQVLEKAELVKFLTDYYNPNLDNLASIQDISNYDLTNK